MTWFRRSVLTSITVGAVAISTLVIGGQRGAWACGKTSTGQSAVYVDDSAGGTEFTKQPPGCADFNLVANVSDSGQGYDNYAGYYLSGGHRVEGTRGFIKVANRSTQGTDIVLLSSVATGTEMWATTDLGTASVTVQY